MDQLHYSHLLRVKRYHFSSVWIDSQDLQDLASAHHYFLIFCRDKILAKNIIVLEMALMRKAGKLESEKYNLQ